MSIPSSPPRAQSNLRTWLGALLLLSLAACGGGDRERQEPLQQSQRRALAADAEALTPTEVFNWAEKTYPTLFAAGPANETLVFDGRTYTIRYYPGTQNYLGVSGDEIFGYGEYTGLALQSFGRLADWVCQVRGQTCLSGQVADDAAWAGATVEARCVGSNAVATASSVTGADGRYSLVLPGASLPCVLRATAATGGRQLHSGVAGSGAGSHTTVHVTPMTDLAMAYATDAWPATAFSGFGTASAAAYAGLDLAAAAASVRTTLDIAGLAFPATADVFGGVLLPGAGGNPHGQALADLQSRLTGGLSQAALADAILRTRPDRRLAGTPSLPANLLLKPAAANCAALRSGSYRAVYSDLAAPTARLTIDAAALTLTRIGSAPVALVPDGPCHYKQADGQEFAVSDAGVIIGRTQAVAAGPLRAMVAFPDQVISIAEVAGSWNGLLLEDATRDGEGWVHASVSTFGADGQLSALTYCGKDAGKVSSDCFTATSAAAGLPVVAFSVNADGGLDLTNTTDGWTDRVFFYRSGSGDLMQATGGHLSIGTFKRVEALPAPGRLQEFWNLGITAQLSNGYSPSGPMSSTRHTVVSTDAATMSFLRNSVFNFTTGATRPERIEMNRFLEGFGHRVPEAVTGSDGSAQSVSEFVSLSPRGMGLAAVGLLSATQSYSLSALKTTAP